MCARITYTICTHRHRHVYFTGNILSTTPLFICCTLTYSLRLCIHYPIGWTPSPHVAVYSTYFCFFLLLSVRSYALFGTPTFRQCTSVHLGQLVLRAIDASHDIDTWSNNFFAFSSVSAGKIIRSFISAVNSCIISA